MRSGNFVGGGRRIDSLIDPGTINLLSRIRNRRAKSTKDGGTATNANGAMEEEMIVPSIARETLVNLAQYYTMELRFSALNSNQN
jgi:hypothetical protein